MKILAGALLLSASVLLTAATPKLSFIKSFPGSVPAYCSVDVDKTGTTNTCYADEFFRYTQGNATPTLYQGTVKCDTCKCDANGAVVRKAGVMSIVVTGGFVRPGDPIAVTLPERPFVRLERV